MRKFTRTEGTPEVVSPEAHKAIQTELEKLGTKSACDLSDNERSDLQIAVDNLEHSAKVADRQ